MTRTDAPPILSIRNVSKNFGGVQAIKDASLEVREGEIVALIGPNGAGKTTLFNTCTGLIPPSNGQILLREANGREVPLQGKRPDQITARRVSRTFQNIRLFPRLSVIENVMLGAHLQGRAGLMGAMLRLPKTNREELALKTWALNRLMFVGLEHEAQEQAASLSYGHQRRLEIARGLANNPRLLLLDEPAAGMNPAETAKLVELIRRIRQAGVTVFLIEHDMKLVMEISDAIYVLDHGEIIASGPPESVQNDPRVVEAYLGPGAEVALG
ncbi:MAG: ABC transporter ATP-binding protein [Sumerlaeia bacterium]